MKNEEVRRNKGIKTEHVKHLSFFQKNDFISIQLEI